MCRQLCQECQEVEKIFEVDIDLFLRDLAKEKSKANRKLQKSKEIYPSVSVEKYLCSLLSGFQPMDIAIQAYNLSSDNDDQQKCSPVSKQKYKTGSPATQSIDSKIQEINKKAGNIRSHISRQITDDIINLIYEKDPCFKFLPHKEDKHKDEPKINWIQVLIFLRNNYRKPQLVSETNMMTFELLFEGKLKLNALFDFLKELKGLTKKQKQILSNLLNLIEFIPEFDEDNEDEDEDDDEQE